MWLKPITLQVQLENSLFQGLPGTPGDMVRNAFPWWPHKYKHGSVGYVSQAVRSKIYPVLLQLIQTI